VGEEGGCSGGPGGEAEAKKCESQAELSPSSFLSAEFEKKGVP